MAAGKNVFTGLIKLSLPTVLCKSVPVLKKNEIKIVN